MSVSIFFAVGIGGFFGAISRFFVGYAISTHFGTSFPYGTLTINALGSLMIGFLSRYFVQHLVVSDFMRMGILVGFLGAFTTFSTFSYETIVLLQEGESLKAGINVVSNGLVCLTLCFAGLQLTKLI
ncbi:fluoride efflux transporter CrcB [Deltaproteobacteria bacterium TL4]